MQIDRVGEPEDVILAADDVGRTGDLRKILRREIGQLQHHVVELVGLEQVPDRHAEGEIGLELVGVGVGAAGDDCAGQLRVVRGDLDGVDAAVAVAHDQRLLQPHRLDELRVVLRHQGVGNLARVAALAVAAAFGQINGVIVREILRRLAQRSDAAAVAVDQNQRRFALAPDLIVHLHVLKLHEIIGLRFGGRRRQARRLQRDRVVFLRVEDKVDLRGNPAADRAENQNKMQKTFHGVRRLLFRLHYATAGRKMQEGKEPLP